MNTTTRSLAPRELMVLLLAFAVSLPAVTPRIYASDEIQYYSYLRSLWFDRDLSFENEYRSFYDRNIGRGEGFHATFLEQYTEAGRRPSFATIGSALLWSPFYLLGDIAARTAGYERDGFSFPYVAAVAYGSAVYGFLAVLLSIRAARQLTGHGLLAGILIWVGTPLLFYMYIAPPYSHACSAFAVALFVTVWLDVRASWTIRGAVALGLAGALMAMVREQDAFLAIGPAVDFVVTAGNRMRLQRSVSISLGSRGPTPARLAHSRSAGAADAADTSLGINQRQSGTTAVHPGWVALSGLIAFGVGLIPQLLAYKALNGHYGPSTLVTRKMTWYAPHALQVLFSPEHGFFIWTPLAVLAIAGLIVLAVRGDAVPRRVAACALLMVAVQVYVSGSVESWTVAGAFGQRRFVALTVILTIGLSMLLAAVPRSALRPLAAAVVLVCLWWNVALTMAFGMGLMDRQRLEPRRNAYVAFVELPRRLPEIAQRYLFRRESFYERRQPTGTDSQPR